jgi:crossover junction endodeoxyribonuclease RuvC
VRILGIDPGSIKTGYGVIEREGRAFRLVKAGVIRPKAGGDLYVRLSFIFDGLIGVIAETQPQVVAVESVFTHKNAQSALVLGHARGVALLAAARAGLPLHEYPPATVKKSITGAGAAEKTQVAFMVRRILAVPEGDKLAEDAADALAVALCQGIS